MSPGPRFLNFCNGGHPGEPVHGADHGVQAGGRGPGTQAAGGRRRPRCRPANLPPGTRHQGTRDAVPAGHHALHQGTFVHHRHGRRHRAAAWSRRSPGILRVRDAQIQQEQCATEVPAPRGETGGPNHGSRVQRPRQFRRQTPPQGGRVLLSGVRDGHGFSRQGVHAGVPQVRGMPDIHGDERR